MIEALIDKLVDLNIDIELLDQDKLKIHTDINTIPGELLTEIKLNKNDLVKYLAARQVNSRFERIPRLPLQDNYEMSPMQRRLWILSQFRESNIAYNIPAAHVFEGKLDPVALQDAFDQLIERHESLRTVFRQDEQGVVKQFICSPETIGFRIDLVDLRGVDNAEAIAQKKVQAIFVAPFDLATGPLIRAGLFQVADDKCIFTYVVHHIISDGWSTQVLIRDLLQLYHAALKNERALLPPLRIQYKDYAAWQQQQLSGTALEEHKQYWLQQFEGALPVLELPTDKVRPAIRTYNSAAVISKKISVPAARGLKALCQETGATLFMGLLAAVKALFYRYTHQEDIIIGTPMAGREHIDLEDQVGFYVNTLALRTQFKGTDSFRALLENVKQVTLGAYKHQVYPFDELTDLLQLRRDESRNPLFDVQVTVKNAEGGVERKPGKLAISRYTAVPNTGSVFEMVWNFTETKEGIHLQIIYNSDIYEKRTVTQLADHWQQLLEAIIQVPGTSLRQLPLLNEEEQHQLLATFNKTNLVLPEQQTITRLFNEQVSKRPGQVAVVSGQSTLTYQQLNEQANRLANYFIETYHVQPGDMIGVMLDRSELWIISILAVLKAGCVYVPVNPEYPAARKTFILQDTNVQVLITDTKYMMGLVDYPHAIFAIDLLLETLPPTVIAPEISIHPDNLAYVIYTSGSTGEPKGVMIEHAALAVSIQSQLGIFEIPEGTRCMQFCSISFDVSVFEIFIALASGASLYLIPEEEKNNPVSLEQFITHNRIDVASIPPAYLKLMRMDAISTLKKLITGGEPASPDQVKAFIQHGTYYNAYGPTESSLCTSVNKVTQSAAIPANTVPIGTPIPYVQVYIVHEQTGLVPVGVTGEIYIGGAGLARGYLNNPGLTAEKFIPHPFRKEERVYRTGDLARWLPDGTIAFIGRKDDQVKIHGNRVELGEIEKVMLSYEAIQAVMVIARNNQRGITELVAYIIPRQPLQAADLRAWLGQQLPAYMLPDHYVELSAFPLTANGKIDKNKLPDPEGREMSMSVSYEAPGTAIEKKLVSIWEEVLGKERVGIQDDYFELGGNSLKAMIVVKKVLDDTGLSLSIKTLFEQRIIRQIAAHIEKENNSVTLNGPVSTIDMEHAITNASYNQLSYFSEWNKKGDHLVVISYDFPQLDTAILATAFNRLIERHEILRTTFVHIDGTIKQKILPPDAVRLAIATPVVINSDEEMNERITREYLREFDLFHTPLFVVQAYRLQQGKDKVLLTMHHIITDGYSSGVLKTELVQLYREALQNKTSSLTALPFQYRHFAGWQRDFVNSPEGAAHRQYWLQKLEGCQLSYSMPFSSLVSPQEKEALNALTRIIDGQWLEELDRFAKTQGLTRTAVLLGVLVLVLQQNTGRNDITIATTVSGRNSPYYGDLDVTGLIGFFANMLLVRNTIDATQTTTTLLQQVQSGFLDDLGHDAYPLQQLIHELPGIQPATFLQSAVFYNYHQYQYNKEHHYTPAVLEQEEKKPGDDAMQLSFVLAVTEYRNCLKLQFVFNPQQSRYAQRIALKDQYFTILKQALRQPQ